MLNAVMIVALTIGTTETIELPVVAIVAAPVRIVRDVQPVRSVIRAKPARRVAGAVLSVRPLRAAKQFIGKRVEGVRERVANRQTRRTMRRQ